MAKQSGGDRGRNERDSRSDSLSTPGAARRQWLPTLASDGDTFGRFAEGFARFMGTARFLAWMTIVIVLWLVWNSAFPTGVRFDPLPYMFLTLILSLQASYAAPLILLAQNRQEARDRVSVEADRRQAAQSRADMDFLAREIASLRMSVGELATRDYLRSELRTELRGELRRLLAELDEEPDEAVARKG